MKYCKNCKKDTERYKAGNCKPCVNSRNKVANAKRSSVSMFIINKESINEDKQVFNKELYSEFNISEIIKLKKSGIDKFVYFLMKDNELVYIGMSNGNLLSRLNSHIKDKDFDSVLYKTVLREPSLSKIEKNLITKYRPKLNKDLIFTNAKYSIFDLKTEEVIRDTKDNLINILKSNKTSIEGLLSERNKKMYSRYVLLKNKPKESSFRKVLDTHTGLIEKHNYITFAEKVNKKQNAVWYFMNGIHKSFMKKRYLLVQ